MSEPRALVDTIEAFVAPDKREAEMHVVSALPNPEYHPYVDDSIGIIYVHGFGENMSVCKINAQEIADLTGNVVTTYDHDTGEHVGGSFRTGLPRLYMDGLLKAIEVHIERFPKTERIEAIGFSLGGMAVAFTAEKYGTPDAALLVKAVGTDGPAEFSTHGPELTLHEQLYDVERRQFKQHGKRLRGAFLGLDQMRMSAPHLMSDTDLAIATVRGAIAQGWRLVAKHPQKHLWAFGVAETIDSQYVVANRRHEVAFGVITGEADPLFLTDKTLEHMSGENGVHEIRVVETGHVPLASSRHGDLLVVRDSLVDLRGRNLSEPTEIIEYRSEEAA